jgi:hypothetical protein
LQPRENAQYLMAQDWVPLAGSPERQALQLIANAGGSDCSARAESGQAELDWTGLDWTGILIGSGLPYLAICNEPHQQRRCAHHH